MFELSKFSAKMDLESFSIISKEIERQETCIDLIPSENYASRAVLEALGSPLNNKYSEGYPGKRYYGGNGFVDEVENLAINRAKKLFSVPHANVQPYSGSPANFAVYLALCKPGDVIMGQALPDGGHLTHGSKGSFTGKLFKSVQYHVKEDGYIDLEEVRKLAEENKPKIIWVGATAYVREFPFEEMSKIADSVGAYLVADISHVAGLVIGEVHKSPVKYAHIIMTTTHKTLRGPRGAILMVTNKGLEKDPELASKIDRSVFPGLQGGPHDNVTAAIAIALGEASNPDFKEYTKQIILNSKALATELSNNGLKLVSGGTDNHIIVVDLTPFGKGMGIFAQEALEIAGFVSNKNTIPKDPSNPFYPSGLRLGTPASTTRGMKEGEMKQIGKWVSDVIKEVSNYRLPDGSVERDSYLNVFCAEIKKNKKLGEIRKMVSELCSKFPIYR